MFSYISKKTDNAVERLPVLHHSADFILHFLWDHWAHCGFFENGVLLMYTLQGVSSVANLTSLLLKKCLNKPRLPFSNL